jgi:hypothetical protein
MHARTMTVIARKPNGEKAKLELLYKPGINGYIIKNVSTENGKRKLR